MGFSGEKNSKKFPVMTVFFLNLKFFLDPRSRFGEGRGGFFLFLNSVMRKIVELKSFSSDSLSTQ